MDLAAIDEIKIFQSKLPGLVMRLHSFYLVSADVFLTQRTVLPNFFTLYTASFCSVYCPLDYTSRDKLPPTFPFPNLLRFFLPLLFFLSDHIRVYSQHSGNVKP